VGNDINILNPQTVGTIQSTCHIDQTYIASKNMAVLITDPQGIGSLIAGSFFQNPTSQTNVFQPSNITPQFNQGSTVGLLSGGTISIAPILGVYFISNTSGTGYVMVGTFPNDVLTYISFTAQQTSITWVFYPSHHPYPTLTPIFILEKWLLIQMEVRYLLLNQQEI
jgi:hypothetical protein